MKKFVYICLALIVVGSALALVGLAGGAPQTSEGETFSQTDMPAFHTVRLSAGSAKIAVVAGEGYGYGVSGVEEDGYEVSLEDGILTLRVNQQFNWSLFSLSSLLGRDIHATVTVPADVALEEIAMNVSSGEALLENVAAKTVRCEASSGSVTLRGVTAYDCRAACVSGSITLDGVRADALALSATSGSVTGKNLVTLGMTLEAVSGSAEISGDLRGDTRVSITSGSASLRFDAPSADYGFKLRATSGGVSVNGERAEGSFANAAAKNHVTAEVTSGDITLDFSDK